MGVQLPCVVSWKTEFGAEERKEKKQLWFLVTSLREKILCDKEEFKELNWRLSYRPAIMDNRWSLKSIESFLQGETVDPVEVYIAVKTAWEEYVEFDNPLHYDLITLFCIRTYFTSLFNTGQ